MPEPPLCSGSHRHHPLNTGPDSVGLLFQFDDHPLWTSDKAQLGAVVKAFYLAEHFRAALLFELDGIGHQGARSGHPMMDAQLMALLKDGYCPPGITFNDVRLPTREEVEANLEYWQRGKWRRKGPFDR